MKKIIVSILIVVVWTISLCACGSGSGNNNEIGQTYTSNGVEFTLNYVEFTDVPTTATVGTDLTLTGTVAPIDATNKTIVWSVKDEGTTKDALVSGKLKTTAVGAVTVTATIENGLTASSDYTEDFDIVVSVASVSAGTVSGKISDSNGTAVGGAYVTTFGLAGEETTVTTDANDDYSIENVPFGIYSMHSSKVVGYDGVMVMDKVTVNQSSVVKNMSFLVGLRSTVIEGSDDIFDSISVAGMNDHYDAYLTKEEKTLVNGGGKSHIMLSAITKESSAVSSDKALIEGIATGKTLGYFVDLSVLKTVKNISNNTITNREALSTLGNVISITLPMPTELQEKDGIGVYCVHNGVAQTLAKDTANANREYVTIYTTLYQFALSCRQAFCRLVLIRV